MSVPLYLGLCFLVEAEFQPLIPQKSESLDHQARPLCRVHLVLTLGGGGGCPGNMSLQLHQHFHLGPR